MYTEETHMSDQTTRNAFISSLDHLYAIAGQTSGGRPEETIVKGPDGEMLRARRDECLTDERGVEIAGEFIVGWDGVVSIDARDGILALQLSDGRTVEIEACP